MQRLTTIILAAFALLSLDMRGGTAQAQELDLFELLSGRASGSGEFRGLDGNNKQITGTRRGVVNGSTLTLTENLSFSDGEKPVTVWTITRNPGGGYVGRRKEVDGPVAITVSGNQFRMNYAATVKSKDGQTYTLSFDETYTRVSNKTITNATRVTYFLVPLGNSAMTWNKAAN